MTNPRPAVSNDPVQKVNGDASSSSDPDRASPTVVNGAATSNGGTVRNRRSVQQPRPTLPPSAESSQDESEIDRPRRRQKPLLQRSKSDYGPRGDEREAQVEEERHDWGARHGFEDHYASEEYVSQLANVGYAFLSAV